MNKALRRHQRRESHGENGRLLFPWILVGWLLPMAKPMWTDVKASGLTYKGIEIYFFALSSISENFMKLKSHAEFVTLPLNGQGFQVEFDVVSG